MNARETVEIMIRTDRGQMTVWSSSEVQKALDAYRAEILREAADAVVVSTYGEPLRDAYTAKQQCARLLRRMADEETP